MASRNKASVPTLVNDAENDVRRRCDPQPSVSPGVIMKDQFANHEIVVLALYLLGGETSNVDTEDIAVKANEIAPGRFSWRKFPEQINIDAVRKRLWDAMKPEKGALLVGSEKDGWVLTENGIRFGQRNAKAAIGDLPQKERLSLREKQQRRVEYERILAHETFAKAKLSGIDSITAQEAEAFFRIDDYVIGTARQRKVQRLLNVFLSDPEISSIVKRLAEKVRMIQP
jgi:hypothetical protein